jgi:hypothetical protein
MGQQPRAWQIGLVGGLALGLACTARDGVELAPVEGVVLLEGRPLANVGVTFLPEGKGPLASGNTNAAGEFRLSTLRPGDGAPVGRHRVVLGPSEEGAAAVAVPPEYGRPETTPLSVEVLPGQVNRVRLPLKRGSSSRGGGGTASQP